MKRKGVQRKLQPAHLRWALERLLNHREPISALAKQLGCCVSMLRERMTELHGERLPLVYPARVWRTEKNLERMTEIVRLRQSGLLQKELGARFGITGGRVQQILRDARRLGLWGGDPVATKIRRLTVRQEHEAKQRGCSLWELPLMRRRKRAA